MYGDWSESLLISEPAVFIHNKEQGKGGEMEGGSWGGGGGGESRWWVRPPEVQRGLAEGCP